MNDNLLTIREASKYLKIHWQTIRNYIEKGILKPIKIGRTIRIRKVDLDKLNENKELKREVELRFILKDKIKTENKLRKLGAKLTNHSHIIDHYYCETWIKNMEDKDKWFDSPTGYGLRIRELDNDYTGKVITSMEIKKLAGPDYNDHSNCLEAEIEVSDFQETERLILMMGKKKFLTIDKERFVYRFEDVKFCFDSIKGWGDGIEIEKITTEPLEKTKNQLFELAAKINLNKSDMPTHTLTYEAMQTLATF